MFSSSFPRIFNTMHRWKIVTMAQIESCTFDTNNQVTSEASELNIWESSS